MTFIEKWIEYDYNPFIIFDKNGKVVSLNQEAQFLLAKISTKVIFELSLSYAPKNYGFNTTFVSLSFDRFKFFAITVGYESEEEIGIKLYKEPLVRIQTLENEDFQSVNIYTILDLSISTHSIGSNIEYAKEYDPTLPEIQINVVNFTKLVNKMFQSINAKDKIVVKLSLNIGEYIKVENKKYSIVKIELIGDSRDNSKDFEIKKLAYSTNASIVFTENRIIVELPLIN
ncbi:MAG: hypothetical protein HXX81_07375 [Campylobacterales bacterium]|nr:hypothetical protein [Campylobacterales bacterium]